MGLIGRLRGARGSRKTLADELADQHNQPALPLSRQIEYTLLIDGHEVAKATADQRGRIEIEVKVPLPAAR